MSKLSTFWTTAVDGNDWATIAKQLDDKLTDLPTLKAGYSHLAFIYVTDRLSEDFPSILTYLRQRSGIEDWVGTIGSGISVNGQEYFDRPAAGVMVITLPINTYAVLDGIKQDMSEISSDVRGWMKLAMPPFGIVHGDPMNPQMATLLEDLSQEVENLTLEVPGFLVGGLAASTGPGYQAAGPVSDGGVSGVLFTPEIEVATGLSQGCAPVGNAHRVTECMENVIMGLDDSPALDVFKEDIGELLARDLNRVNGYIHAAFPIEGSDTGDYTVRNLIAIDKDHGWIGIGGAVMNGDRVLFVRRDPKSAEQDLTRMVENLINRLPAPPRAALYFSCVARGPSLFGKEGRETEIIQEILGNIPMLGFFGNGEISNNRLYGYTGVLTLFL
jgi:small ligand-binding sensory domain FIST